MITQDQLKDVMERTESLHRYLEIDKKKIEFEHVNKTKDEILKENIAKIPNFVPYEPNLINKGRKKL